MAVLEVSWDGKPLPARRDEMFVDLNSPVEGEATIYGATASLAGTHPRPALVSSRVGQDISGRLHGAAPRFPRQ